MSSIWNYDFDTLYNWVHKYHKLATFVATTYSKDPSTKVGAVAIGATPNLISLGYNGFPPGIRDTRLRLHDRETKLKYMVHAEENALINALFPVENLITTLIPCNVCAKTIIANRVKRVFAPYPNIEYISRPNSSMHFIVSLNMLGEAGVEVNLIPRFDDLQVIEQITEASLNVRPYKYFASRMYYHDVASELAEEHEVIKHTKWYEEIVEEEKLQWLKDS